MAGQPSYVQRTAPAGLTPADLFPFSGDPEASDRKKGCLYEGYRPQSASYHCVAAKKFLSVRELQKHKHVPTVNNPGAFNSFPLHTHPEVTVK